jgi:hypothetical protein
LIISFLTRLLFAAYFFEAGLILIVAPWSALWSRNLFADAVPALAGILANPFLRGAVSGIGAITAIAGLGELASALAARRRRSREVSHAAPLPDPEHENS